MVKQRLKPKLSQKLPRIQKTIQTVIFPFENFVSILSRYFVLNSDIFNRIETIETTVLTFDFTLFVYLVDKKILTSAATCFPIRKNISYDRMMKIISPDSHSVFVLVWMTMFLDDRSFWMTVR